MIVYVLTPGILLVVWHLARRHALRTDSNYAYAARDLAAVGAIVMGLVLVLSFFIR